jgi:NADH:ubiquinone oxidoreductase subunit 6 (subunit J)
MDTFLFMAGGLISLIGTLIAVAARHIFHAALGLAIALIGTAGLFVPLGGELISVIQLLVYLGAVAIAIVFVLMLSPPYYLARPRRNPLKIAVAAAVAILLALPLARVVWHLPAHVQIGRGHTTSVDTIGHTLLADFVFPFEIISLVLTITIIGAIVLARDLRAETETPTGQAQTNVRTASTSTGISSGEEAR